MSNTSTQLGEPLSTQKLNNKISAGNFFEDFTIGQVINHATPRTITLGDSALYIALTGSRNPLHCSEPFAQSLGYTTTPVDDLLAFHIAFGKTVPDISVNAVANLGYADIRFLQPVFVGDTLSTSSEVIGLKQNSSGKNGVVWVRSTSVNQRNEPVISWVRWVMVHKNNLASLAPDTLIPELPAFVMPAHLNIPAYFSSKHFATKATGGQYFWQDYQIGERLNHPSSMIINDSDHSQATRLYQNNAKLHFNYSADSSGAENTHGKPLVYGGVVISLCRAMSYDGLENALSLLAINAGTHANPSFAGDTIYTFTQVLDRWDLEDTQLGSQTISNVGALRLRMVGIKNLPTANITDIKTDGRYHPNVVLDLDYTVLMPKRP